jgi:outer membrane protein assembly factor BamA
LSVTKKLIRLVGKIKKPGLYLTASIVFSLFRLDSYAQQPIAAQDSVKYKDSLHLAQEVDIFQVLRKWTGKPPKTANGLPKEGVKNLSLLPIVGYTPANGFVIGAAISITEFLGAPKTTNLSSALINVSLTTKNQVLMNFKYDIFTPGNKWSISGDNRLLLFNQATYGLGIYGLQDQTYTGFGYNGDNTRTDSAQPMKFNYIRLYETFLRKVAKKWYAGLALMIDDDFKINDESLRLDSPVNITSHYEYSKAFGFDTAHYSANGLAFVAMHDSRDNPINAYSGNYFNIAFRVNPLAFGSSQASTMVYYEYRTYFGLNKSIPRNVLAFWLWGVSVTTGHMPYLQLPAITWDTYNRSGRGYIQGRFRGNNMAYGESEFRFRLSKNDLFGGVVFVNCTTASNPLTHQPLFNTFAPGYGFGLRILMNKNDRTNICVDYGRGDGFSGIYFNIREAF